MLAEALLDKRAYEVQQTGPGQTPSPFGEGANVMLQKLERKIGNIFAFELAEHGAALIADAKADFLKFERAIVLPRESELVGVRINICAKFNAINA